MISLADFLLARIAEDKAMAEGEADFRRGDSFCDLPENALVFECWFSPARVLADCEARERIVKLHRLYNDQPYRGTPCCARCTAGGEYPADDAYTDEQNWPCPTLRALALPYADRSDFRGEWRL